MVLNILLAIVGLIVGLGLGFVIAKSRHDKAIMVQKFQRRVFSRTLGKNQKH